MFDRSSGRGLSLRVSLLLFLVLPLIGVLSLAGYFSLQRLEQEVEKRMQEDIELIARAIRGPLEYSMEQGREGSIEKALSSVFRFGRVYGAYVYDKDGKRIASSGPSEPVVGTRHLAELAAEGDRKGEYRHEADGQQVYSYFVPLSDSGGLNTGLLQLTREGSDFKNYINQVRHQALVLLILLSLLLLGIVVYGHHRLIGRNLGLLVRSMSRIEGGDRDHRASFSGPREIRQLTQGMNAMLDSIERSERKLDSQRQEQAQLERRLQQSEKMAAIGQLAAGVAHELGTPLSVVSGKAQRMQRRNELPEIATTEFREIRDAVQRMEHIVRQLLDFGRGNGLRLRPTAFADIAECAASQVRDEAAGKGVALTVTGPRPSPVLPIDRVRLEQALVNLVRNAVQATGPGGQVYLEWFDRTGEIGFRVTDDGPGVPEENHARLFEPFFTTKPVDQGTGLGLAVAQAAVRDHAGRLEVDRSDLGGASFSIIIEKTEDSDE
ncbi:MAG: ATP-binding protein [Desulfuromonadales bacterium]